jgi:hypothetical protein
MAAPYQHGHPVAWIETDPQGSASAEPASTRSNPHSNQTIG